MNRNKLKNYAPRARRDFIAAVTDRAAYYGLTKQKIEPITEQGDVALIGGRPFPRDVAAKRRRLETRITQHGFEQVMEAMAYTWFNRLVAIRFMELHGYLDHGYRVLSHPEGKPTPEILEHAEHVELPGLKQETVIDLKLAWNREGELYRLLLTAQCNALHTAMPFLFEKIDDETELLLPDNLLHSDSLIRKLVSEVDEEDWQEVEIIGWLYQFYISEKKDQVIGKVVASEDIPAATQLFTPNWIVKYLVQNTLGRQWLATYPQSALRQQMQYYIEPAEQTPEVQEQLKAITPTSLNPEELTLLDPACGSGHILVEAYDLFKAIYQERGYRARDIPALILQKNLFGLEIDDRAAQLAAFALMMKARADDRRIFDSEAKPNILAFQDSRGMNAADITHVLNAPINKEDVPSEYLFEEIEEEKAGLFSRKALAEKGHVSQGDIATLLVLFENAKTFGSLIQVPLKLAEKLPEIEERLEAVLKYGDLTHASAHIIKPLLQQARLLARQYDAVVANPPYMGSGGMNGLLRTFAKDNSPSSKSDLFAVSAERFLEFANTRGYVGLMTPFTWMFLKSYEALRGLLLETKTLQSLIQPEYHAFFDSAFVPVCAFTVQNCHTSGYGGSFIKLSDFYGAELQWQKTLEAIKNPDCGWLYISRPDEFKKIPGSPVAYWASATVLEVFEESAPLGDSHSAKSGVMTGDDDWFLKFWFELRYNSIGFGYGSEDQIRSLHRFFPMNKEEGFRRWAGRWSIVLRYVDRGAEYTARDDINYRLRDRSLYFKSGISWGDVTSGAVSFRYQREGVIFSARAPTIFSNDKCLLAFLNSGLTTYLCGLINPTLSFNLVDLYHLPLFVTKIETHRQLIEPSTESLLEMSEHDWNSCERSWDFQSFPLLTASSEPTPTLESSYIAWITQNRKTIAEMKRLEEENNRLFIDAYGLAGELAPDVPVEQITLTCNPAYRYSGTITEEDQWTRFRRDTMEDLVSYAMGCIMGRYSLDKPGLVYAHSGNQSFDPGQYKTFRADDDGIIPLFETDWGIRDDAVNRIVEFIGVAWPKEHLEENLKFIADSLGPANGEQPRETIRRYLATGFYKHHLSMYKKRPIYWLFSSGKQRAFQCLVYLHRYNESTLSRMRIEYVIPLQGKISSRISQLADDIAAASSTSHRKKLEKERDTLVKQQAELRTFDEKLRHYADKRINLDLDDGVKVNYGKFGDLLAEVKAVTGGTEEL